ncbi:MAG: hypothetical protein JXA94_03145, partial [Parachlamydiales bacterium]|nr:hypothetical protein [Parachlamydiales bacterium]
MSLIKVEKNNNKAISKLPDDIREIVGSKDVLAIERKAKVKASLEALKNPSSFSKTYEKTYKQITNKELLKAYKNSKKLKQLLKIFKNLTLIRLKSPEDLKKCTPNQIVLFNLLKNILFVKNIPEIRKLLQKVEEKNIENYYAVLLAAKELMQQENYTEYDHFIIEKEIDELSLKYKTRPYVEIDLKRLRQDKISRYKKYALIAGLSIGAVGLGWKFYSMNKAISTTALNAENKSNQGALSQDKSKKAQISDQVNDNSEVRGLINSAKVFLGYNPPAPPLVTSAPPAVQSAPNLVPPPPVPPASNPVSMQVELQSEMKSGISSVGSTAVVPVAAQMPPAQKTAQRSYFEVVSEAWNKFIERMDPTQNRAKSMLDWTAKNTKEPFQKAHESSPLSKAVVPYKGGLERPTNGKNSPAKTRSTWQLIPGAEAQSFDGFIERPMNLNESIIGLPKTPMQKDYAASLSKQKTVQPKQIEQPQTDTSVLRGMLNSARVFLGYKPSKASKALVL